MLARIRKEYVLYGRCWTNFAFLAMLAYRFGAWVSTLRPGSARWVMFQSYYFFSKFTEALSGIWIAFGAQIGEDVILVHSGNIKIHREAVIGDRVSIMHDVTIGMNTARGGVPTIGDDVLIGAGAKVLGGITIGEGATIAPNSLVITDVPRLATVMGVPSRVMPTLRKAA